jgi:tetratricopeptide (TPR) repeat protein
LTLATGKLEKCTVCGGPLGALCVCNHCSGSHPPETYSSGRTWTCPACKESIPIQFACKNCGTRYLYEEVAKEGVEGATQPPEEALQAPKPLEKPIHRRPPRRLKGEFDESDVREIARLPGVGSKRAELLCRAGFNSILKIKSTSQDVISAVPGIGPELAKSIKSTTNLILLLPRRRSKEEMFDEERECPKCGLPMPVFSEKCLECGSTFEVEDFDETIRREFERLGIDAVIEYYGRVLFKKAEDAQLWYALGLALSVAGRVDAARKAVRKAKKLNPENPKLRDLEERLKRQAKPAPRKEKEVQPSGLVTEPVATQLPERPTESPVVQATTSEGVAQIAAAAVSKPPEVHQEKPSDEVIEKPAEVRGLESLEELKGIAEKQAKTLEEEPPVSVQIPPAEDAPARQEETRPPAAPEAVIAESPQKIELAKMTSAARASRVSVASGRRPLLTGYGLVNGRGRVNGLINGNGFVNGGTISDVNLPRGSLMHRYAAVAAFLLVIFLIVNTSLQLRVQPGKSIQIDGSFGDWQPIGTYHDATVSGNPDTNLVSYALKVEGQSLFFMARVEGTLFGDTQGADSFYIFFDVDADNSTGYSCGALGAEYMVMVDGFNSSVSRASLQAFNGQDRSDWNKWSNVGAAQVAVSGDRIEGEIQTDVMSLMNPEKVLARFVVDDQEGGASQSAVAIGFNYGFLKVTQRGLTQMLSTGPADFLELTFEVIGPELALDAGDIVIDHTPGTQINGIAGLMTVSEGNRRVITLTLDASVIATGEVVRASLTSVTAERPVTIVGSGARAYVLSPPAGKRVDGLFADWPSPHSDSIAPPVVNPEVDIEAYDANASGETAFFYFRTVADSFKGSLTPKHEQRVFSSPGTGGGGSSPLPRLTGESIARVFIESNSSIQDGFPIGGILADYMIEAKGQFGVIDSISAFQWQGRWVIFSGTPKIAIMADQVELSASIAGLDLSNASYVIQTGNWRNIGDQTATSGTRGGEVSRTRGTYIIATGTDTLLYAKPTSIAPTIDGDWSSTEWQVADSYESSNMIVYAMQNGTYLFICIRVKSDTVQNAGDYAELAFDTDHDGDSAPDQYDKKFSATDPDGSSDLQDYYGNGGVWDPGYSSAYFWEANGTRDTSDGNYITWEFSIPFQEVWNTPSPGEGQEAGLAIHAHDDEPPSAEYYWGSENLNDPSSFGHLEIPEFQDIIPLMALIPAILVILQRRRSGKNNKPRGH